MFLQYIYIGNESGGAGGVPCSAEGLAASYASLLHQLGAPPPTNQKKAALRRLCQLFFVIRALQACAYVCEAHPTFYILGSHHFPVRGAN